MMDAIAIYVIPVLSIALTYILGRLQAVQSDKKAAFKEAYETFYLPYISLLYETNIWDIGFARLNLKDQNKLFRMVLQNVQYMDKPIIEYLDILYSSYGEFMLGELDGIEVITTPQRLDEMFDELTGRVLSRATLLANKLHQPRLGEFVRELYLESQAAREMQDKKVMLSEDPR